MSSENVTVYTCDRCGLKATISTTHNALIGWDRVRSLDLCPNCAACYKELFQNFMDTYKSEETVELWNRLIDQLKGD